MEFIGLDTKYVCADGRERRRIHLDGAASPLASAGAIAASNAALAHYSNTHSRVHTSARISTELYQRAHDTVLEFVGADSDEYAAIFIGHGCTAAINRVARGLAPRAEARPVVLVSSMEHHANDLPHRVNGAQVEYLPVEAEGECAGTLDINAAKALFKQHDKQTNYIAISTLSNVTGIKNDWPLLTAMAHDAGAYVLIDAAQSVAHSALNLSALPVSSRPDFVVFSGHKLYAPTAPGVLVARKELLTTLSGQDMGGGSVVDVTPYEFELLPTFPDREESGTPNIIGSIALAAALRELINEDLSVQQAREQRLMNSLHQALEARAFLRVYGSAQLERLGAIAFNHQDIEHGLLAAILNDYYAIAVRNECFCAHPYVSAFLKDELWDLPLDDVKSDADLAALVNQRRGMVRVSVSAYTSSTDIEKVLSAIDEISGSIEELRPLYEPHKDGRFTHRSFTPNWPSELPLNRY